MSCDKYPMSWYHGLASMLNMLMCDPEDKEEFEFGELKDLDNFEKELSMAIISWVDNIVAEVE